jgi:glycosyltransferase involved in cell wall biosynthesis
MKGEITMEIRIFSPAYNVGKPVGRLIEELADVQLILHGKGHEIKALLINDNSTDNTRKVLNQAAEVYAWIEVRHNEKNLGNAENILAGYTWGADSNADVVGCLDADGEHSPYAMIRHLRMIERGECDGVSGSIIFPDHHIDRKAIEKTMLEINSLGASDNSDIVKKALEIIGQLSQEIIAADDHNDRNMMRFWGRMQSTMAGIDGTFYIQSPGYNLHQRHRVAEALELFDGYQKFFADNSKEVFPRWGLHGVIIHLIAVGTGAHIKAAYLECFGKSPNRTPDKLLLQANAANIHSMMLGKFISNMS